VTPNRRRRAVMMLRERFGVFRAEGMSGGGSAPVDPTAASSTRTARG
jgi:hypothetical protein